MSAPCYICDVGLFTTSGSLSFRVYYGYHGESVTYTTTATLYTATSFGLSTQIPTLGTATGNIVTNTTASAFTIEWNGFFLLDFTGSWTFRLNSDDGSYLWLGSLALAGYTTSNANINNAGVHAMTLTLTLTLTLT